jgi:hypothetical protein
MAEKLLEVTNQIFAVTAALIFTSKDLYCETAIIRARIHLKACMK